MVSDELEEGGEGEEEEGGREGLINGWVGLTYGITSNWSFSGRGRRPMKSIV